jgi:sRNA-binding protein
MANKAKASYEKNRAQRIKASADYAKATREAMKPYRARKAAERRAAELRATPRWLSAVQISQIAEFYDIAHARQVQTGVVQHVDHIVPLQGKSVRGLHVPWNLQVLTEAENCSKHNRLLGFQT